MMPIRGKRSFNRNYREIVRKMKVRTLKTHEVLPKWQKFVAKGQTLTLWFDYVPWRMSSCKS